MSYILPRGCEAKREGKFGQFLKHVEPTSFMSNSMVADIGHLALSLARPRQCDKTLLQMRQCVALAGAR